jgi:hypothetical protein
MHSSNTKDAVIRKVLIRLKPDAVDVFRGRINLNGLIRTDALRSM